jgi:hypothetical protein
MTREQTEEFRGLFRQIIERQVDPKVLTAFLEDIKNGLIRVENGVLRVENKVGEIQKRQAPRALSTPQRQQLASVMSAFRGQIITFDLRRNDSEVDALIVSLRQALSSIGIALQDAGNVAIPDGISPGLIVMFGKNRADAAHILSRTLVAFGLAIHEVPSSNENLLRLVVGPKPIGDLN